MKSAIVTGATGFIGRNLVKKLSSNGVKVYAIVRNKNTANSIKLENVEIIECEMADYEKLNLLINKNDVDMFYHLAWDGVFGDKRADYNLQLNNIKYACEAIKVSHKIGVEKFIFLGTMSQYQNSSDKYKGLDQNNIYGIAKFTANSMIKNLAYKMNIQYILGTVSNIYGPSQSTQSFINYCIKKINNNEKLSLTSGMQLYDFMYVNDAVEALYLIGIKTNLNDEYYIGNESPRQLKEFVNEIGECIDKNADIAFGEIPYNGVGIDYNKIQTSCLYKEFNFKCETNFKTGINNTLEWLRESE